MARFWSLTLAQGVIYGIVPAAILRLLLGELLDASRGVQTIGEVVALLVGLAWAISEQRAGTGWGSRVAPGYRMNLSRNQSQESPGRNLNAR